MSPGRRLECCPPPVGEGGATEGGRGGGGGGGVSLAVSLRPLPCSNCALCWTHLLCKPSGGRAPPPPACAASPPHQAGPGPRPACTAASASQRERGLVQRVRNAGHQWRDPLELAAAAGARGGSMALAWLAWLHPPSSQLSLSHTHIAYFGAALNGAPSLEVPCGTNTVQS